MSILDAFPGRFRNALCLFAAIFKAPFTVVIAFLNRKPRRIKHSLLAEEGSGRGLWGSDSRKIIGNLRDEWERK